MDKFTLVFQESRTERNMRTHDIRYGKSKKKLSYENQNKSHAEVTNSNREMFQLQGTVASTSTKVFDCYSLQSLTHYLILNTGPYGHCLVSLRVC
jgi:hypothetical protein